MTLAAFVLDAMLLLAPGRDHHELADAVTRALEADRPFFAGDADRHRTAALVVAIAFRESSLRLGAVGDDGKSFCAMQVHATAGGSRALLTDVDACVRMGVALLRTSLRSCPSAPVALYAGGPKGCELEAARRVSVDRMWLAQRIVRELAAKAARR